MYYVTNNIANIVQNFKKYIMQNIFKLRKCCVLEKSFGIIEFFYLQDIFSPILQAKFEFRSPCKIGRYIADSFFETYVVFNVFVSITISNHLN